MTQLCKHGCVKMFCSSREYEFEKVFEFKTRQVYFISPIPSSAQTWKTFKNKLCQFFQADMSSEKNPYANPRIRSPRLGFAPLSRIFQAPLVFLSGYAESCKHGNRFLLL